MDSDDAPPPNVNELVAEFCGITGAQAHIAEHYLSACNWDINRAIEFFLEEPPDRPQPVAPPVQAAAAGGDDDDALPAEFATGRPAGGEPRSVGFGQHHVDEDDELQRALAASLAASNAPAAGGSRAAGSNRQQTVELADDMDLEDADEDLQFMARQREAALAAARDAQEITERMMQSVAEGGMFGEAMMFPGLHVAGTAIPPPNYPYAPPGQPNRGGMAAAYDNNDDDDGPGRAAAGAAAASGGAGVLHDDDDELQLPEGMSRHELEEARMMEAAMLGIPYEGRLPDFRAGGASGRAGPSAPVDPSVREQRSVRWEQDQAYEESLALDRAKAEAAERARHESEAAERAAREAAEAEARRVAEEEAALARALQAKAAALPAEPGASDTDSISVMVRMPDGSRLSRRFLKAHPFQAVFDFLDVTLQGQLQGQPIKPGAYTLVMQYPRRVYEEGTPGSLAECGLDHDSALFLQLK